MGVKKSQPLPGNPPPHGASCVCQWPSATDWAVVDGVACCTKCGGIKRPTSPTPPRVKLSNGEARNAMSAIRNAMRDAAMDRAEKDSLQPTTAEVAFFKVVSDLNYEVGYLLGSLMGLRYVDAESVKESIDRIIQDHAALEARRHKIPGST